MKEDRETQERLERQIHELKKEIAELSSLLALRKLEYEHPRLERLVSDISRAKSAIKREAARVEEFGHEHFGDVSLAKTMAALGGILLIGGAGYAVLSAFGILGGRRR